MGLVSGAPSCKMACGYKPKSPQSKRSDLGLDFVKLKKLHANYLYKLYVVLRAIDVLSVNAVRLGVIPAVKLRR